MIRFEPFPGSRGSAWDAVELERPTMALYEHIFLARQDVTQQQVEALTEQIKTTIASLGGAVTKVEPWGLKSLAFRIKKNRKAHFTMLNIAGPSEAVVETERLLSLNEDVIRYLTIRVDEHEAGPSAMLRKREESDRDDRGPRGPRGDGAIAEIGAIVGIGAIARRAARVKTQPREHSDGQRPSPTVFPPPQVVPVFRRRTRRRSTTRTFACCRATSPSAARSCLRASPRSAPASSANSPKRSSAPGFWASCLT